MDTQKVLFKKFHVHIVDGVLDADCFGEKINRNTHDLAVDVKGATMTELRVVQKNQLWIAQCVVDV
jgi:SHS2 domain-containing protein